MISVSYDQNYGRSISNSNVVIPKISHIKAKVTGGLAPFVVKPAVVFVGQHINGYVGNLVPSILLPSPHQCYDAFKGICSEVTPLWIYCCVYIHFVLVSPCLYNPCYIGMRRFDVIQ